MAYVRPRFKRGASPPGPGGKLVLALALVPPNADRGARFHVEFLQNVLHVLLHSARAASQNLADLAVTLSSGDPFYDFALALRQGARPGGSGALSTGFR